MSSLTLYNFSDDTLHSAPCKSNVDAVVNQVRQIERRVFPKAEALNFDNELKKRNTELSLVRLIAAGGMLTAENAAIIGYAVVCRVRNTALLHKVCVVERCRRQGIARALLLHTIERLRTQSCKSIGLWVDSAREPAVLLYQSLGFVEAERVTEYYGSGRAGIKMVLTLERCIT